MLRLGISSCLLGERVRYDGEHKRDALLADRIARHIHWIAVCPEVEAGMGIPREPIRIETLGTAPELGPVARRAGEAGRLTGSLELRGIESRRDWTRAMEDFAERRVAVLPHSLHGWVFKARSPSCGVGDAPRFDAAGSVASYGDGFFAAALARKRPDLPRTTEARLEDPTERLAFFTRAQIRRCREELEAAGSSPRALTARHWVWRPLVAARGGPFPVELDRIADEARSVPAGDPVLCSHLAARYGAALAAAFEDPFDGARLASHLPAIFGTESELLPLLLEGTS